VADGVFEIMGRNPLLNIALECERIALEDDYFIPASSIQCGFYTGLIYQSMGFPVTMFPVLFAIPRTSGWIAQWEEMLLDPEQKSHVPVKSSSTRLAALPLDRPAEADFFRGGLQVEPAPVSRRTQVADALSRAMATNVEPAPVSSGLQVADALKPRYGDGT